MNTGDSAPTGPALFLKPPRNWRRAPSPLRGGRLFF